MYNLFGKKKSLLFLLVFFSFVFLVGCASNNLSGRATYVPGDVVVEGYAPPWDVFNNNLLFFTVSDAGNVNIAQDGRVVYNVGYYTVGDEGYWTPFQLSGSSSQDSAWITNTASASLDVPAGAEQIAVITYSCIKDSSGAWKCGCKSQDECGLWTLQLVNNTQTEPGVCNHDGTCNPPNETPDNCPDDCGGGTQTVCGDGVCNGDETEESCPGDCSSSSLDINPGEYAIILDKPLYPIILNYSDGSLGITRGMSTIKQGASYRMIMFGDMWMSILDLAPDFESVTLAGRTQPFYPQLDLPLGGGDNPVLHGLCGAVLNPLVSTAIHADDSKLMFTGTYCTYGMFFNQDDPYYPVARTDKVVASHYALLYKKTGRTFIVIPRVQNLAYAEVTGVEEYPPCEQLDIQKGSGKLSDCPVITLQEGPKIHPDWIVRVGDYAVVVHDFGKKVAIYDLKPLLNNQAPALVKDLPVSDEGYVVNTAQMDTARNLLIVEESRIKLNKSANGGKVKIYDMNNNYALVGNIELTSPTIHAGYSITQDMQIHGNLLWLFVSNVPKSVNLPNLPYPITLINFSDPSNPREVLDENASSVLVNGLTSQETLIVPSEQTWKGEPYYKREILTPTPYIFFIPGTDKFIINFDTPPVPFLGHLEKG